MTIGIGDRAQSMHPAAKPCAPKPAPAPPSAKLYNARHPEKTLLYRIIANDFETWRALASAGQFDGQGDHHTPSAYVTKAFHKYLQCGIFAHGFARARCDDCGHDFFVAFSCKGRGVCPSCNSRRMAETAAGGPSGRSRISPLAGAPVGAIGTQAAAVFYAKGQCCTQCCLTHLSARAAKPSAPPLSRRSADKPSPCPHRCGRLHPPLRFQPQHPCPLPCMCGRWDFCGDAQ